MNKIIRRGRVYALFSALAFILFSCWPSAPEPKDHPAADGTVIKEFFNENGKLHSRASMLNGVLHGPSVSFYSDGTKNTEVTFVNGKKEGIEKKYYGTGELYRERTYAGGEMNGPERRYYKSGQLMAELSYQNGNPGNDLREYKHHGGMITKYPDIVFSLSKDRDFRGQILLVIRFSDMSTSGRFYYGGLLEGKYFNKNASLLPGRDGVYEMSLSKPAAGQKFTVSGMKITEQSTPFVLQKTFVYP